jgi:phospholipid/cholesterol/gamma-HCH transport system substrate-binding protein
MTDVMARITAVFIGLLLLAAVATLWITSHPGVRGTEVQAEFDDVYPLLPGMHVRVDGAIAGSVGSIDVTDRGTALVTLQLNEGTSPPRADATAAIRQQDITGDSYVALEPGDSDQPLGDKVIPRDRTIVAPRFDDLLNSFDQPVRQGLKLLLVELGKALENRGEDLNAAVLELRPGLEAANEALAEVRSQNAALRGLVGDAENVTGQLASHSRELGSLIDSLSTTLQVTAERRQPLDAALDRLPETNDAAHRTLGKLADLAVASEPLARSLAASAPDLRTNLTLFKPFLEDARVISEHLGPSLDLLQRLFVASLPTLRAAPSRVLTAPLDIASASGALLNALLGQKQLQKALFSADGYGHGDRAGDDVGLGALGVESGDQLGYSGNDPYRDFIRADTVLTCESFGLPVRPGCLASVLRSPSRGAGQAQQPESSHDHHGGGAGGGEAPPPVESAPPEQGGSPGHGLPENLQDILDQATGNVDDVLNQINAQAGGPGSGANTQGAVDDLLDLLFGS